MGSNKSCLLLNIQRDEIRLSCPSGLPASGAKHGRLLPMDGADGALPTRLLVVDDESSARTYVERALRDAGYAVDTAVGGPEALSIVEHEGTFDLFVLDVMMPEMDGHELARRMRDRHPDAKVLYFTGNLDRLLQEQTVLGKNEAILAKPATMAELRETVSLLLFDHTHGPKWHPEMPRGPHK
jgi:CheY-like chemotaxis protein